MRKILVAILFVLSALTLISSYSEKTEFVLRDINLGVSGYSDYSDYSENALSNFEEYEIESNETRIEFTGVLDYQILSSKLSTTAATETKSINAYYDLESNIYNVSINISNELGIVDSINYSLSPNFVYDEHPDIILDIDGVNYALSDVLLSPDRIEDLCALSVLDPMGGAGDSGDIQDCSLGGGGLAEILIILLVPLADYVITEVVNVVTNTVTEVINFFKWVYNEITTLNVTQTISLSYVIPLDIEGIGIVEYEMEKVDIAYITNLDPSMIYLALVDFDGSAYVSIIPISETVARSVFNQAILIPSSVTPTNPNIDTLFMTLSTYTFNQTLARELVGVGYYYHGNQTGSGMQFKHYHPLNVAHAHSLFGIPIINP